MATPPVLTDASGAWEMDGVPLTLACKTLRATGEAVLEVDADRAWNTIEPVATQVHGCGVRRLGLQTDGTRTMFTLEPGGDPVVSVGPTTHVVHGGAASEIDDTARDAALFWRAFPNMTRPCLVVAPTAPARMVSDAAKWVHQGRGRRPGPLCLLLDRSALAPPDRQVVELLRGGEIPAGETKPTGHLTQWFGQSVAPVAEEKEVPLWTRASSLICAADGESEMWGIGTVSGIRNQALARVTADNRARAEIAKLIQVQVSRSKGSTKTFSAQTLSGVQIVDHFMEGRTTWALATLKTDREPSQPCPTGQDTVREWSWRKLDPSGGFGTNQPDWARAGLHSNKTQIWVTTSSRAQRPLAEATALLDTLARSQLTVALARGALAVPGQRRADTGEDCLLTVPWLAATAAAPVEAWYDVESATIFARASLELAEVRGALGPGCDTKLIDALTTVTQRRSSEPTHTVPADVVVEYPEWVLRGSGVGGDGNNRVFLGVGSVSGIKNHALARTTADNRARAEIAKVFEVFSASLMRDYMRRTTGGTEEQHVGHAIKTFSAMTLSGIQVVDHWFHPDGTVYALAQLDLDTFEGRLGKMRELNRQVLDYVRKNAERVHRDLEKEEQR